MIRPTGTDVDRSALIYAGAQPTSRRRLPLPSLRSAAASTWRAGRAQWCASSTTGASGIADVASGRLGVVNRIPMTSDMSVPLVRPT
jgi:hypothetical protein